MDLDRLNEKQKEAALYTEGPLLILAGAGSGKTSTMTHRIAYLVEEGVSPYEILAVTFTNKAAKEMRDRVERLIGECGGMWILTFHSMCLRILHRYCELIGYDRNFVIYDGTDQKTVVKNIMKELYIDDKSMNANYFLSVISNSKEKEITAEQFRLENGDDGKAGIIFKVYDLYERTLKKNNAMDFDDILLNALKLFRKNEEVLAEYQERFKYVMVDEYQDTNHVQYMLVKMLSANNRNLCVVGDDDQCIYQWRGADIRNILDFEKDFPEAKVVKLEQNYRSYKNILAGAYSVIKNNRDRKEKKLWTEKEDGNKIKYYQADNEKEEAQFIARQIDVAVGMGRKYSDFAILYRVNALSQALERGLTLRQIPYRVLAGLRYYDRKEIKDILAYMRMVVNPSDALSLKRVINEPKRGIGGKTIEKLETLARVENRTLYAVLEDAEVLESLTVKAEKALKELLEILDECRQEKDNLRVSDIYDILLEKTGYLKALADQNTVESEGRIENLLEFKSVIYDYEKESETPTIEEFMENISLVSDIDNHDESEDTVVLMTMHSAKGLEFPVVFMPGMEDGLFPGNSAFDGEAKMEEERRLCYVGMTRAKEQLYLTGARSRMLYGKTDYKRESQFLRELDKHLVEGDSIYERSPRKDTSGLGVNTGSADGYSQGSPFKPFDPIKYAKSVTQGASAPKEFAVGDMVTHGKFKDGKVLEISDKIIVVDFAEAGIKKMAIGVAPLKKK